MTSVSSPWIPEDDLLLKNSIEAGASLEALAKGAVKFSRRYTYRELRDRWYSILYDPDVSVQASARMVELELSGSNPSTKSRSDSSKGNDKVLEKRKFGSIRRHYYAMRKRIKNEFFSSPNLGFFEERNLNNYNHQEHNNVTNNNNNAMIDDCLANNLGFEENDFEILRQAFPEATTTTTTVDNPAENNFINNSMREDGLYKFTEAVSPSHNELTGSIDPNTEMKNASCHDEPGSSENLPKTDKSTGFGGKQIHFNSPVSDGSASFHTLGFSSPSTRLPIWKVLEDVSAPDMPVDEKNHAESHQISEEKLILPEDDGAHQDRPNNNIINTGGVVQDGEFTDLPDSLLNFSNDHDDLLFMDVDVKDPVHDNIPKNVLEADLYNAGPTPFPSIQRPEELKDIDQYRDADIPSTSASRLDSVQLTEGQILCTLNMEDPDIPCNDDIFLLIHPSTQFTHSVGPTDAIGQSPSSSHENGENGPSSDNKKGTDHEPCFTESHAGGPSGLPVGSGFKHESPDAEHPGPIPGKPNNNLRIIPGQTRPVNMSLEINGNGLLEEGASKVELRGLGSPAIYSKMPILPIEVDSVKMIDPEAMGDSRIDDMNNSDSDGDIPYFSDVEAMILEMDLANSQESCITNEIARYQNEDTKKMIMRLEQAARSSFHRALSSQGALAIFYGRRLKYYMKKTEVTVGRSTDDTEVDIDLRKEGRANKISRRQAIIKMEANGSFNLKNLGASSISLNGKEVAHGQMVALPSSCLIEIRGMCFLFEINDKYVRRFLHKQPT